MRRKFVDFQPQTSDIQAGLPVVFIKRSKLMEIGGDNLVVHMGNFDRRAVLITQPNNEKITRMKLGTYYVISKVFSAQNPTLSLVFLYHVTILGDFVVKFSLFPLKCACGFTHF